MAAKKPTAAAKAGPVFSDLRHDSKVVPFPKPIRSDVFQQPVEVVPFPNPQCGTLASRMPDPKSERRSKARVPVQQPVSVKSEPGGVQTTGHTRDLSTNGIFLYVASQITEGSELEMVLILPPELTQGEKQWVCCRASVVRVEESPGGGPWGVAARIQSMDLLPEIGS